MPLFAGCENPRMESQFQVNLGLKVQVMCNSWNSPWDTPRWQLKDDNNATHS